MHFTISPSEAVRSSGGRLLMNPAIPGIGRGNSKVEQGGVELPSPHLRAMLCQLSYCPMTTFWFRYRNNVHLLRRFRRTLMHFSRRYSEAFRCRLSTSISFPF